MYHYSPKSTDESIDERFDFFYTEKNTTQLDGLFSNLTVSPPLSTHEKEEGSICDERNDLVWFKESIDDDEEEEEDEGIDEKLDYHYTKVDLLTPVTSPLFELIEDESSINERLVEEAPVEAATIMESIEEVERKAPSSMYEYHMGFVNLYKDAILSQTDPHTVSPNVMQTIESTLPDFYKNYVDCVKKSFSIPSTCL